MPAVNDGLSKYMFWFIGRILPLKKAAEEKIQAIRMAATSSFKAMLRDQGDITPISRWSRVSYGQFRYWCLSASDP